MQERAVTALLGKIASNYYWLPVVSARRLKNSTTWSRIVAIITEKEKEKKIQLATRHTP